MYTAARRIAAFIFLLIASALPFRFKYLVDETHPDGVGRKDERRKLQTLLHSGPTRSGGHGMAKIILDGKYFDIRTYTIQGELATLTGHLMKKNRTCRRNIQGLQKMQQATGRYMKLYSSSSSLPDLAYPEKTGQCRMANRSPALRPFLGKPRRTARPFIDTTSPLLIYTSLLRTACYHMTLLFYFIKSTIMNKVIILAGYCAVCIRCTLKTPRQKDTIRRRYLLKSSFRPVILPKKRNIAQKSTRYQRRHHCRHQCTEYRRPADQHRKSIRTKSQQGGSSPVLRGF